MGRSVNVPSRAVAVIYFSVDAEEDEWFWDDLVGNLSEVLTSEDDAFESADHWIGDEGRVILENRVVCVVLSEYCGLCSLAFVPVDEPDEDIWEPIRSRWEDFVAEWAGNFSGRLLKILPGIGIEPLRKVGTFSNGESVYERAS